PAIGRPAISVDQRTNSVIVRGSPAAIAAVADVIRQLDQPVQMIEIQVVIATTEVGVAEQLGVALRGGNSHTAFDTGTTGGQLTPGVPFNALTLLPAVLGPQSTIASFVVHGSQAFLQAQLSALADRNKARVLSAPHIVTLDNVTARITRSEDLYVPVDTGGLNGQGLSQIQTGLTLEITPSIVPAASGSQEEMVRLSLDATDSAPGSGTGSQINVNSQEVQTDVLVPNGGTYVIGGLFDDSNLKSRSGIPVLKDIPFLGALFRTDSKQKNLGETVFFITPRIVDEQELTGRDAGRAADTARYIDEQRHVLAGVTQEMDGSSELSHGPRSLEEDE
ncbi:MAG: type II secretion system protein GspD, partial [Acidisphaera sp.]|nr:type II secretion system protein GspD [Acidisphaera sp.]